jgi:CubicO group peptidase (beta-lactamase class C family)
MLRGLLILLTLFQPLLTAQTAVVTPAPIEERMVAHVNRDRTATGMRVDWVRKADRPFPLKPATAPFAVTYRHNGNTYGLDDYFQRGDTLAFIILKDDQVIFERYLHSSGASDRYLSMSVSKSVVSVLFGVAIEEGKIGSVKDPVVRYLPYLEESGYNDCTLENVLHMATGVLFSEEYDTPSSGIGELGRANRTGTPTFGEFAASLKPEVKPGTAFHYQSVNTQVLALVLEKATGMSLNKYAEEKLWKKIGTESDAFFLTGEKQTGVAAYGSFFSTLRDYARFGLMAMRGGQLGDARVVGRTWIDTSSTPAPFAKPRLDQSNNNPIRGYGYQWWIPYGEDTDRAFQAVGIRGQAIYVNPTKRIVIAQFSAWPAAGARPDHRGESTALYRAIVEKLSQ